MPLRVAVMGCVVNGPGEAREADLGVASGNGKGQIFVKGEVIKTVPESQIVETLIEEAMRIAEEMGEPARRARPPARRPSPSADRVAQRRTTLSSTVNSTDSSTDTRIMTRQPAAPPRGRTSVLPMRMAGGYPGAVRAKLTPLAVSRAG